MYKKNKPQATTIQRNEGYQGESIEQKIDRILNNKEPIKDGAPLIYTERKDGVVADYDIRTDRFEAALNATDYISKSKKARREARLKTDDDKAKERLKNEADKNSGAESIGGTNTEK